MASVRLNVLWERWIIYFYFVISSHTVLMSPHVSPSHEKLNESRFPGDLQWQQNSWGSISEWVHTWSLGVAMSSCLSACYVQPFLKVKGGNLSEAIVLFLVTSATCWAFPVLGILSVGMVPLPKTFREGPPLLVWLGGLNIGMQCPFCPRNSLLLPGSHLGSSHCCQSWVLQSHSFSFLDSDIHTQPVSGDWA